MSSTITTAYKNRWATSTTTRNESQPPMEEIDWELLEKFLRTQETPELTAQDWWDQSTFNNTASSESLRFLSKSELIQFFQNLTKDFRDFTPSERQQIKSLRYKTYKISPIVF